MSEEDDPLADVVGVFEVAKELGVPLSRVRRWIDRGETTQCPKPLKPLHMGYLYSMTAWRDWHIIWKITRAHGRPSRRKPKAQVDET